MQDKALFAQSTVIQSAATGSTTATNLLSMRFALRKLSVMCASMFYVGILGLPLLCYASGDPSVDNKEQLKTIQQNVIEKEKRVKRQKLQRNKLQEQLKLQENTIAQASRLVHETQITLTKLSKDVSDLTLSIQKLQQQQSIQQDILAKQLEAAFKQGRHRGLQLVLDGEEGKRGARMLAYFSYLNRARRKVITELEETRTELAAQKEKRVQKQRQQKMWLMEQQKRQAKLEQTRAARQATLTALEASLARDQQRLNELKLNEMRLRNQLARAERKAQSRVEYEAREVAKARAKAQQANRSGSSYKPSESERLLMARTGGLGQPNGQAIWPVHGRIAHRFGEALQGELRWKGMVISAQEGSEVKAIADGRVLLADWLRGYGLMVVVEHGKGDMSLYGYNQSTLVNVGEQVKAGQSIALVGTSGGQGEPSLYFAIRRRGQAVNPQPWLGK